MTDKAMTALSDDLQVLGQEVDGLMGKCAYEIGVRLKKAREIAEHGTWGKWLEARGIKRPTAHRMMVYATRIDAGDFDRACLPPVSHVLGLPDGQMSQNETFDELKQETRNLAAEARELRRELAGLIERRRELEAENQALMERAAEQDVEIKELDKRLKKYRAADAS